MIDKYHIFLEAYNNLVFLDESETILNEFDETETDKVKELIDNNNNWIINDYPKFFNALAKTSRPQFFTVHTPQEFKDSNTKTFLLNGYNIGYALMPAEDNNVDIISVFNNEPNIKNIGDNLIKSAIKNGGTQLDHYDVKALSDLYDRHGLKVYDKYKWDSRYAHPYWDYKKYGKPDVLFRRIEKPSTYLTEFFDMLKKID